MTMSPPAAERFIRLPASQLRAGAVRRVLEQHSAIDIVRQEAGRLAGHSGDCRDFRDLGPDLRAGVATAHHQHAQAREGVKGAISGRMDLLAMKQYLAGLSRDEGLAGAAGGADHGLRQPRATVGLHRQSAGAARDALMRTGR